MGKLSSRETQVWLLFICRINSRNLYLSSVTRYLFVPHRETQSMKYINFNFFFFFGSTDLKEIGHFPLCLYWKIYMKVDWWVKASHSESSTSFWFVCKQRLLWMQVSILGNQNITFEERYSFQRRSYLISWQWVKEPLRCLHQGHLFGWFLV